MTDQGRAGAPQDFNALNLRLSHPNWYRGIMVFALLSMGLGVNFWLTTPTFNPLAIPKEITGAIFFGLGVGKVVFLNAIRNLRAVRTIMATEIAWMCFWGVGTAITWVQGKTSLQLFLLYVGMAVFEVFLLVEPPVNPLTAVRDTTGDDA